MKSETGLQGTHTDELTITHTRAAGTLVDGTARGDGSAEVLKAIGWHWSRHLGAWYLPCTRDLPVRRWKVDQAAEALRAAGFAVAVEIDDRARPTAEVEADRAARQAARVDALHGKAARRASQADAADAAERRAFDALPPMGEPIKVGHHSEGRHRRALERAERAWDRSMQAHRDADHARQRAEAAEPTTAHRFNPGVTRRRIDRIEADRRRYERSRTECVRILETLGADDAEKAARVRGRITQLDELISEAVDQASYWRDQLEAARAAGVLMFDRSMLRRGDRVKVGGSWWPHPVQRVNPKTVTVGTEYSWTHTVPYSTITGVRNTAGQLVSFDAEGRRSDER
ncbi:DUF3560 domain-containing protein [Nocardia sp. NPDC051750]|uniref:DUF3560 domain-containing protein n=1 Tax=Nocardia sp. NPDC051750 TaxID=3364325 RepID=UPI00378AC8EE